MRTHYVCPDKERTLIKNCIEGCRMARRCAPLSYLKVCAVQDREWKGTPSVTQLIKGTREAYLMITEDYAVDPQSEIYALMGTGLHMVLERFAENPEETVEFMGISGTSDELEGKTLLDYKNTGSYKVALALGMTVIKEEEIPTGKFLKSGAGRAFLKKQLNNYLN